MPLVKKQGAGLYYFFRAVCVLLLGPSSAFAQNDTASYEQPGYFFDVDHSQASFDQDAINWAETVCSDGRPDGWQAKSRSLATMQELGRWKPITDDQVAANRDEPNWPNYRYHLGVTVDFDRDDKMDWARLVRSGDDGGILVHFSEVSRPPLLIELGLAPVFGQGLFAGQNGCLIFNLPEVSIITFYQDDGSVTASSSGE